MPTLVDGDYVLWDSHAINPYIVSKYAKDDSLYPKDIKKRGIVDNRLHYSNATIFNTFKDIVVSKRETVYKQKRLTKSCIFLETHFPRTSIIAHG